MADSGLYPISLLMEEMKLEDTEARIKAMRKLKTIAVALGPERTRTELIPFLSDQVEDDDEVLLVMAEQLGEMVPLVGGYTEAGCLMELLGRLCTVEETVVRDKAVESACTVISGLDNAAVTATVVPVLTMLSNGDWFTARVSACGLFAVTYSRLTDAESRRSLRKGYHTLCNDETPMVRRAASKHIGDFANVMEKELIMADLLPLFNLLAGDDQDSVRLLAIENCTAFSRVLGQVDGKEHVLPLVKACAVDKSWRVRNNVAKEFFPLSEAMGAAVAVSELLPLYTRLLLDPEPEVRASACKNLSGYTGLVGFDRFKADILEPTRACVNDTVQNVRVALAESLMTISANLTAAQALVTVTEPILTLLNDETPEVRLKILESLAKVAHTVGPAYVEGTLLPVLLKLGADALWRVRERVIAQMPMLAGALGASVFEERLLPLYLSTYQDQVNAVRMAATKCLQPLAHTLGGEWVKAKLVPKLRELWTPDSSYLQRITVLYAAKELCAHPELADVAAEVLPLLTSATKDEVPNVRFVAAQALQEAIPVLSTGRVSTELKPLLSSLAATDSDPDVRHFAGLALERA